MGGIKKFDKFIKDDSSKNVIHITEVKPGDEIEGKKVKSIDNFNSYYIGVWFTDDSYQRYDKKSTFKS